jgi:hypothetical protein
MRIFKNLFFVAAFVILAGCSMNKTQIEQYTLPPAVSGGTSYGEKEDSAKIDAITGATKAEIQIVALAGASYGGIVDNDAASGIEGISDVDAITGATKLAYNVGIHSIFRGHGRAIEIGLDYINFNQTIEYDLPSLSVNGARDFEFHQIRLPVTYNFEFFKNNLNKPKLALKLGFSAGYTLSKTIEDSEYAENMPVFEFTDWDIGPDFGLYFYPFDIKQSYRVGLYMDAYRGRKIYEDAYHDEIFLGDHSFIKFGVVFEP